MPQEINPRDTVRNLILDETVSAYDMLMACVKFMEEDDVREMLRINGFEEEEA